MKEIRAGTGVQQDDNPILGWWYCYHNLQTKNRGNDIYFLTHKPKEGIRMGFCLGSGYPAGFLREMCIDGHSRISEQNFSI
jgi:hypothetical protein